MYARTVAGNLAAITELNRTVFQPATLSSLGMAAANLYNRGKAWCTGLPRIW